jgi:flavin reductase (DIM6/NTAB) family NADH-FMN oxidoreductase RutF
MDQPSLALEMRQALRRFAKAVVVITTELDGKRHAMAATAVSEVSMDPPSMLICVNKNASIHAALSAGSHFCINILRSDQGDVSAACSGAAKGEARFETGDWAAAAHAMPRLTDAQASFICTKEMQTDYGSHSIFIGQVNQMFVQGDVDPLVYVDGRYTVIGADVLSG